VATTKEVDVAHKTTSKNQFSQMMMRKYWLAFRLTQNIFYRFLKILGLFYTD